MAEFSIPGLLGFSNEDELRKALAQLGGTPQDSSEANNLGLMAAGFKLMGTRKGQEWQGLGDAGLAGLAARGQKMDSLMKQRGQDISQLLSLRNAAQQNKMTAQLDSLLNSGRQTEAGPPAPFPAPGGGSAERMMNAGLGLDGPQPEMQSLPTRQLSQQGQESMRQALAKFNMNSLAGGGKDYSAAIKTMFPDPISMRANAFGVDPGSGKAIHYPTASPGHTIIKLADGSFSEVPLNGGLQAVATSSAIPKATSLAFAEPVITADAVGQKTIPGGSRLDQMFGGRPLPFGVPSPYGSPQGSAPQEASPQGAAQPTKAPLITAIGPGISEEVTARGKAYAGDAAAIDQAAAASQQANARNQEMRALITQFKPGVATPFRASTAAWFEAAGASKGLVDSVAGGDLSAIKALEKQVIQTAFDTTKQFSSRPAQSEVIMQATKGTANSAMPKPAIEAILDYNDGLHRYLMEKQQAKEAWIAPEAGHGGSLAGFEAAWNKAFPLDSYIPSVEHLKAVFSGKPVHKATGTKAAPSTGASGQDFPEYGMPEGQGNLAQQWRGNATAKALVARIVKSQDPVKIKELYDLGYLQR